MNVDTLFRDKINQLIFLEINDKILMDIFHVDIKSEVYFPVQAFRVIDKVKTNREFNEIAVSYFVEGMLYMLGCDEDFKYNKFYKKILTNSIELVRGFARKTIYQLVEEKDHINAYLLLKGYVVIEGTMENYSKQLMVADKIRSLDKDFVHEELRAIEKAKELKEYPEPFLYEAQIYSSIGDFRRALDSLREYLGRGGAPNEEVVYFKKQLQLSVDYEVGKEQVYANPENALRLLLPLIEELEDDALIYYYVGVCYRLLGNYEKSIYYLNESLVIDSTYPEVVNELGLNFACLDDFDKAILYFRKAFEATRTVEICTNLITCYINKGDLGQAKLHLDIAKKIDAKDDIVVQLDNMLRGKSNGT